MSGLGLAALVLALLVLRQNLMVVLGCAAAYAYLVWGDGVVANIVLDGWDALNKDVLLSIPLYLLAGNVMAEGAIAARLVRVMRALAGPGPGGLAIAAVLSCALFAAIVAGLDPPDDFVKALGSAPRFFAQPSDSRSSE